MGRLNKFWCTSWLEKRLFTEAVILLLILNIGIKIIPFKYIERFLRDRWATLGKNSADRGHEIDLVHLSLSRAASILPLRSLCLSRSIAGFIMFRRREIPAIMFLGVKLSEGASLRAHAWVLAGHEFDDGPEETTFTPLLTIGARVPS